MNQEQPDRSLDEFLARQKAKQPAAPPGEALPQVPESPVMHQYLERLRRYEGATGQCSDSMELEEELRYPATWKRRRLGRWLVTIVIGIVFAVLYLSVRVAITSMSHGRIVP